MTEPTPTTNADIRLDDSLTEAEILSATNAENHLFIASDTNNIFIIDSAGNVKQIGSGNFTATTDPAVTDDSSDGYSVGSFWLNTSSGDFYICKDATEGSAVWEMAGGGDVDNFQGLPISVPTGGSADVGKFYKLIANFNRVLWTEDISQSSVWSYSGTDTIDGTDGYVASTTNGSHQLVQSGTDGLTIGEKYVLEAEIKAGAIDFVLIESYSTGSYDSGALFNADAGDITPQADNEECAIFDKGDGWYLGQVEFTADSTSGTTYLRLYEAEGDYTFAGDGSTVSMYIRKVAIKPGTIAQNAPYIKNEATYNTEQAFVLETDGKSGYDDLVEASKPDLAWDDATRTFSCSVKSGSANFYFWCNGVKFTKTTTQSVVIPDTTGTYYTYFDNSGVLQYMAYDSITDELFYQYAITGLVYWNATTSKGEVGNELHGHIMDARTHAYNHLAYGARYESGGGITGLTSGGDTFTLMESIKFWDEDIRHEMSNQSTASFIYRSGSDGAWVQTTADNNLSHNAGGTYDVWNEYTGSTWQLTQGGVLTDYWIVFHVATPDINIANCVRKIIGQNAYANVSSAREAISDEINTLILNGLPTPEIVFLRATIVNRSGELQELADGSLYLDLRTLKGGVAGGNASGNATSIQSIPVSETTPTAGQVLAYNATTEEVEFSSAGTGTDATSIQGASIDSLALDRTSNGKLTRFEWRENRVIQSENITYWGAYQANDVITYNLITPSTDDTYHYVFRNISVTASTVYYAMFEIEGDGIDFIHCRVPNANWLGVTLQVSTGEIVNTIGTPLNVSVERITSTRYKVRLDYLCTYTGTTSLLVYPGVSGSDLVFAGDATSKMYVHKAQLAIGTIADNLPYVQTTTLANTGTPAWAIVDDTSGKIDPPVYKDITQYPVIRNLTSSAGNLDYDYTNHGVEISDSTDITVDADKLYLDYQINHDIKLDGTMKLHIHWKQDADLTPNFWGRWRFKQNGKAIGSWNEFAFDENELTYGAGYTQITSGATINFKDAVGGTLAVSDLIDVEVTRDSDNSSGLFAGADPVSGGVTVYWVDGHVLVDSAGSATEYSK